MFDSHLSALSVNVLLISNETEAWQERIPVIKLTYYKKHVSIRQMSDELDNDLHKKEWDDIAFI